MTDEDLTLVRGSGNVFRDLAHPNPEVSQLKALLAAEIVKILDRDQITVRQAHARTGVAAADFSRLRKADLGRFTVDRLMAILNRLGATIELNIEVRSVQPAHAATA